MTVDQSCALQTLEGRTFESDGEQYVALTMWATLFVDNRHLVGGQPLVPFCFFALPACIRR